MRIFIYIITLLLLTPMALGAIDGRNGNFSDTWIDLQVATKKAPFSLKRIYNSRSSFNGLFGWNWCSNYETKLELVNEAHAIIRPCGAGQAIHFYRKEQGKSFYAITAQQGWLKWNGKQYVHFQRSGYKSFFNKFGYLQKMVSPNYHSVSLKYDSSNYLKEVHHSPSGHRLKFLYNSNRNVKKVRSTNKKAAHYVYDDGLLTQVQNAWLNVFRYRYNASDLLVNIKYPDATSQTVRYKGPKKWASEIRMRNGCVEKIKYKIMSPLKHAATARRKCPGRKIIKARFEYVLARHSKKQPKFKTIVAEVNKKKFTATRSAPAKRKPSSSKFPTYKYNRKGWLTHADYKDEQFRVKWDERGRLLHIKTKKNGKFYFSYIDESQKPKLIGNKDFGEVYLNYYADGSVKGILSNLPKLKQEILMSHYRKAMERIGSVLFERNI